MLNGDKLPASQERTNQAIQEKTKRPVYIKRDGNEITWTIGGNKYVKQYAKKIWWGCTKNSSVSWLTSQHLYTLPDQKPFFKWSHSGGIRKNKNERPLLLNLGEFIQFIGIWIFDNRKPCHKPGQIIFSQKPYKYFQWGAQFRVDQFMSGKSFLKVVCSALKFNAPPPISP